MQGKLKGGCFSLLRPLSAAGGHLAGLLGRGGFVHQRLHCCLWPLSHRLTCQGSGTAPQLPVLPAGLDGLSRGVALGIISALQPQECPWCLLAAEQVPPSAMQSDGMMAIGLATARATFKQSQI